MEMRIELVPVPVTDTDSAIEFYTRAGFVLDHDFQVTDSLRFVQLTPVGSKCSIVIGDGITPMQPGTQEIQCVVADARALRQNLLDKGIETSEIEELDWGIFTRFADPDGNKWAMQQPVPQSTQQGS